MVGCLATPPIVRGIATPNGGQWFPMQVHRVRDRLGEHNEEILHELLSLTDKEIAGLYADKILVRDPLLDTS